MKNIIDRAREITKQIAMPAGAVLVAIAIVIFTVVSINGTARSLRDRRTAILSLQRRIDAISSLNKTLRDIGDENVAKVQNGLPSTDNIVDFISYLENLAAKQSFAIIPSLGGTQVIANVSDNFKIAELAYSASLTNSNIGKFITYLKTLESSNYFIKTDTITLRADGTRGWEGPSSISMSGSLKVKQNQ